MTGIFKKVAIFGLGQIGGSLALDIKNKRLAEVVIGVSRREEIINLARTSGAIDWGTTDFLKAAREADLIFLCQPVLSIIQTFKKIAGQLQPEAIVTDVGSTKGLILSEIKMLCPKNIYFIGGHPMAGSEKSGWTAARPDLFAGAVYILSPLPATPVAVLDKFSNFIEQLGAEIVTLAPVDHDRIVAAVSHLPYLTAVALVKSLLNIPRYREILKFAAGGFRDTTRVAASPPEMWQDICLTNREEIIKMITLMESELGRIKETLIKNQPAKLSRIIKESFDLRNGLFV